MERNTSPFLDLARTGRHQWWTYLLGVSVIVTSGVGGSFVGKLLFNALFGSHVIYCGVWLKVYDLFPQNLAIIFSILVVIRLLHGRPFRSLVTAGDRICWQYFMRGFGLYFVLFVASILVEYVFSIPYQLFGIQIPQFSGASLMIPVVMISIAVAEELLFRGYVLQGLGLLTQNRVALAVANGLLFMLVHLDNPGIPSIVVFEVGFFLTIITLKSNGLELAIGMHTAHDLAATIIELCTIYQPIHMEIFYPISAVVMYLILFHRRAVSHTEAAIEQSNGVTSRER